MIRAAALLSLLLATPAVAGEFLLSPPIDCDLGKDCYIQQYVDHDAGKGASDFMCAPLSYDAHKGTDFALVSRAQMRQGVKVVAAAPGIVAGRRDGMPDTGYTQDTAAAIKGKECGNGVVLRHQNGWETQYCHMRQGSITMAKGDVVRPGDVLGLVGQSGRSQFPHLHLSVRKDKAVIDPFDPDGTVSCGTPGDSTLWVVPIPYRAGGLLDVGFADDIPEFDTIKAGTADHILTRDTSKLVMFTYAFGVRKGDVIHMRINSPNATLIEKEFVMTRNQAQVFRAVGKKHRKDWDAGTYTGIATLTRDGTVIEQITDRIVIAP